MPTDVLLPKLGFAMDEGTLSEWLVPDGTLVKEGQPIYSIESEKSVNEVEAPAAGKLKVIVEAGMVCKVGTLVGVID
jgi:pyruvate/2-oxoglutarate dehydrogenase complex dihydrolipoamide acyltransferase (E2) component